MSSKNPRCPEELLASVLEFIDTWDEYWESTAFSGPSKQDLDAALEKVKQQIEAAKGSKKNESNSCR